MTIARPTCDLLYMQALNGHVEILERAIPADRALAALVNQAARAADFGPGATFHLVPSDEPLHQVRLELARAREIHAPLNSAHEAYAVLLEELEEFWVEVKNRTPSTTVTKGRKRAELIQLAAMAIRAIEDLGL